MKTSSRQDIDNFIKARTVAIAGVSRNVQSFSAQAVTHLSKQGYELLLVNPAFENSPDSHHFKQVSDLPDNINYLLVLTPPAQTLEVIKQAIKKGIKNIWIQQYSETSEALLLAQSASINLVFGHCIFMFTQPEGFHKFHYNIKRIFRSLPS